MGKTAYAAALQAELAQLTRDIASTPTTALLYGDGKTGFSGTYYTTAPASLTGTSTGDYLVLPHVSSTATAATLTWNDENGWSQGTLELLPEPEPVLDPPPNGWDEDFGGPKVIVKHVPLPWTGGYPTITASEADPAAMGWWVLLSDNTRVFISDKEVHKVSHLPKNDAADALKTLIHMRWEEAHQLSPGTEEVLALEEV